MNCRIAAPGLDFYVDVRLRNFGAADSSSARWLAVADIAGEHEVGLGIGPREALTASLSSLGPLAATALLADPQLRGLDGSVPEGTTDIRAL